MKIIYITRTYAMNENTDNCAGYRNYTVNLLKKKYNVLVVTPGYNSEKIIDNNGVISIPYIFRRKDMWLERVGVYDDYLKKWVDDAAEYLKGIIYPEDIVMAVSGGELGCIMLAARLKRNIGCKIIVHFHDPVAATVKGKKSTLRFHVTRDRVLGKYLKCADEIITCSEIYKEILEDKYGQTIPYIHNVYMGFRGKVEKIVPRDIHKPVHLVYAGTMSRIQGADRFVELFSGLDNIEILYVGNASESIKNLAETNKAVKIVDSMPHDQYIRFIKEKADVGLVALSGDEFGACVPSKIFELINLEIPIFAILPDGDAKEMINNGYGYACKGDDKEEVNHQFLRLLETDEYETIRDNMRRDKSLWQMDKLFEDVYGIIDSLARSEAVDLK